MAISYKISEDNSRFLEPAGDAEIDVVNNMAWTYTPQSGRKNVPTAYLTEYQMTQGQLVASFLYYARLLQNSNSVSDLWTAGDDPAEVYKFKYFAKKTGFSYKFPYFNTKKHSRTTDFGYEDGQSPFSGIQNLGTSISQYGNYRTQMPSIMRDSIGFWAGLVPNLLGAVKGAANSVVPGKIEFEHPQSWTGSSEGTYTITFDLFNTGTTADIDNNRNLAYILAYQNSPSRRTFAIVDPTVIYSLSIPDIVSMPACYMNNVEITNLGNTRNYVTGDGKTRIVPEAYRFVLSITPLLMPTRNIMQGMDSGNLVETIGSDADFNAIVNALTKSITPTTSTNISPQLPTDGNQNITLPSGSSFN